MANDLGSFNTDLAEKKRKKMDLSLETPQGWNERERKNERERACPQPTSTVT